MAREHEVPRLRSTGDGLSFTTTLEQAGLGADEIEEVVRGLSAKQRTLLLVFKKLLEFYMNAYTESLTLYEVALRENERLRRWIDARLPGEEDILLRDGVETDDGESL